MTLVVVYVALRVLRYLASLRFNPSAGQAVLITGCDTGFGRLTAERLANNGFTVFAGCLTEAGEAELSKLQLKSTTGKLHAFRLDVTSQPSVDAAVAMVKGMLPDGRLNALINNAGVLRAGLLDASMVVEDLNFQLSVNTVGPARMASAFFPLIRAARGRIVTVASSAGRFAPTGLSTYAASKFAVVGMCEAWRRDVSRWGVRIITIQPGAVKTALYDTMLSVEAIERQYARLSEETRAVYPIEYFHNQRRTGATALDKLGGSSTDVVDALEHAVASAWPYTAYVVGWDARLLLIPLSFVPAWLADAVWKRVVPLKSPADRK